MTWAQGSRREQGYGTEWQRVRLLVLRRDKFLCQRCLKVGRIETADCVDHVVPKAKGGTDAMSNLQSLSKACHMIKSLEDFGRRPRPQIGIDGYPVDPNYKR